MAETIAFLTKNKNNYSVFKIGDLSIKFYTSPNLQRYCNVTLWKNNGYIEYTGVFTPSPEPIEDTIDLEFIAERLHLPKDVFHDVKEVRVI